ncbi:MAG TPA: tRNA (adenosine(37)-N6)-dimethylallyltransferase MiaA [Atribacter sp.]|jgi:tRNA dimethylallyltransferase|uniref:tRNA (adenosine(37)-N6)-dimethylallyltransferase MiaA n=1 Tax=Atribacter sp. TaxID=2847780 RepID=UPI002C032F24|nr:tRNA (adenosine(37)-N6)-dimethylallyltransferase MiaA [Atribacter sp.]MDI9595764.1 tRNA (adenosine(37)-N6)-dimethylallyltransferase MiaA [Atribacterota bacterium]HQK82547.1 tRNA (adenosine(37)-N6)-dimethylallyltransferase MiaA [Atribacter sp.]
MENWFFPDNLDPMPILCLAGPTASGKTDLSIFLAQKLGKVELIYADSMAIYKYLNIGTAKPSIEQRGLIPHHLIDLLEPDQIWSSFRFRVEAFRCILECLERHSLPIIIGGTGFYLKSLYQPSIPQGSPAHPRLRLLLERYSNPRLFAYLVAIDPPRAFQIGKNDRKRLIRALEIYHQTGKPPTSFKKITSKTRNPFQFILIGLDHKRVDLKRRITERTQLMIKQGLIQETQDILLKGFSPNVPALKNFTYGPVVQCLQGRLTIQQMEKRITIGTFQYLKRQLTWFRKAPVLWISTEGKNFDIISDEIIRIFLTYCIGGHSNE